MRTQQLRTQSLSLFFNRATIEAWPQTKATWCISAYLLTG